MGKPKAVNLKDILERYGEAAKVALQKQMEQEAEAIVQDMKSRVPVKTGKLRDSIRWEWNKGKTKITIIADAANNGIKYARIVEFSPRINKPFFFPAIESHREEYKNRMKDALRKEAGKVGKG